MTTLGNTRPQPLVIVDVGVLIRLAQSGLLPAMRAFFGDRLIVTDPIREISIYSASPKRADNRFRGHPNESRREALQSAFSEHPAEHRILLTDTRAPQELRVTATNTQSFVQVLARMSLNPRLRSFANVASDAYIRLEGKPNRRRLRAAQQLAIQMEEEPLQPEASFDAEHWATTVGNIRTRLADWEAIAALRELNGPTQAPPPRLQRRATARAASGPTLAATDSATVELRAMALARRVGGKRSGVPADLWELPLQDLVSERDAHYQRLTTWMTNHPKVLNKQPYNDLRGDIPALARALAEVDPEDLRGAESWMEGVIKACEDIKTALAEPVQQDEQGLSVHELTISRLERLVTTQRARTSADFDRGYDRAREELVTQIEELRSAGGGGTPGKDTMTLVLETTQSRINKTQKRLEYESLANDALIEIGPIAEHYLHLVVMSDIALDATRSAVLNLTGQSLLTDAQLATAELQITSGIGSGSEGLDSRTGLT